MVFETMNPAVAVTVIAAVILLVINVFYKFLVDQEKSADLKQRTKFLSQEAGKHKDDPGKSKEFMKEMMSTQRDMMRMSMKPMVVSLIVVAIALPLLAAEFHDITAPLDSGEITLNGNLHPLSVSDGTLAISSSECRLPCTLSMDNKLLSFSQDGDEIKAYIVVAVLPFSLPMVGSELGWILWYILVSIPLAIVIRAAYGIRT